LERPRGGEGVRCCVSPLHAAFGGEGEKDEKLNLDVSQEFQAPFLPRKKRRGEPIILVVLFIGSGREWVR